MRHRIDDVVDPDAYPEGGIPLRISRVVGVLPRVAKVHVVANRHHDALVVIENSAPVRRVAAIAGLRRGGALLTDAVAEEELRAGNLIPVVEIEHRMEDLVLAVQ